MDLDHAFQPLTTARLTLREITTADAPFILALTNEPSFIEHIGDRGVRTIADAERYIETSHWTRYATHGFGLWLVQLRETGDPIGICGLVKRDALPGPDIGFAFSPSYWSQGYAFEAASFVKTLARDVFKLPRLLAIVNPPNASSIRLLTKLGLTFERMVRLSPAAEELALYAVAFDTIAPP